MTLPDVYFLLPAPRVSRAGKSLGPRALRWGFLVWLAWGGFAAGAQAEVDFAPPGDEAANFQVAVLLTGLDNPAGLALRPAVSSRAPQELYLAESGAGRVLRLDAGRWQQPAEVVTDFSVGSIGDSYRAGPVGLAFLSPTQLLVTAQSTTEMVSCYVLPEKNAAETVLHARAADHTVGLREGAAAGGGRLSRLIMTDTLCVVSSGATPGVIWKSNLEANRLVDLRPLGELPPAWGTPTGLALIPEPRPPFLVVGLMGERQAAPDSRLAYLVPSSGELAWHLPTGLRDIVSLAYSPTGQLYAADFSWQDAQSGGVYRLDDAQVAGRPSCRAVKIAALVHPFGLAFDAQGALYVTTFGSGENAQQGTLVKISGKL